MNRSKIKYKINQTKGNNYKIIKSRIKIWPTGKSTSQTMIRNLIPCRNLTSMSTFYTPMRISIKSNKAWISKTPFNNCQWESQNVSRSMTDPKDQAGWDRLTQTLPSSHSSWILKKEIRIKSTPPITKRYGKRRSKYSNTLTNQVSTRMSLDLVQLWWNTIINNKNLQNGHNAITA